MDKGTPTDKFVDLPRGKMHLVAVGDGPAVVMLHGWPGFWYDYRRVLPVAGRLSRCVAPDFFGFGQSERIPGDPADVADEVAFAHDIISLLDALELEKVLYELRYELSHRPDWASIPARALLEENPRP